MHSSDDEEDRSVCGSEDGTSSNSSSHKHTSFDRHLVLVGKDNHWRQLYQTFSFA